MNTPSLSTRAAIFVVGALVAGLVAAGVSDALPDPYPLAVGFALALPVMDVALYPERVPTDATEALRVGVAAALVGAIVGCIAAFAARALALGDPWTTGVTGGATFIAVEYGGRWLAGRIP